MSSPRCSVFFQMLTRWWLQIAVPLIPQSLTDPYSQVEWQERVTRYAPHRGQMVKPLARQAPDTISFEVCLAWDQACRVSLQLVAKHRAFSGHCVATIAGLFWHCTLSPSHTPCGLMCLSFSPPTWVRVGPLFHPLSSCLLWVCIY